MGVDDVDHGAVSNFRRIEPLEMYRQEGISLQTTDYEMDFADVLRRVQLGL